MISGNKKQVNSVRVAGSQSKGPVLTVGHETLRFWSKDDSTLLNKKPSPFSNFLSFK